MTRLFEDSGKGAAVGRAEDRTRLLRLAQRLIADDPAAYERALVRYLHHDRRFVDDPTVRARWFATAERVRARLAGQIDDTLQPVAAALGQVLDERPRAEERFQEIGLPPELVSLLAQQLGVYREAYLAHVAGLPTTGDYAPRYLNLGPSGRCNLRCPTCILWGALFRGDSGQGLDRAAVLGHLDDAARLGDDVGLSLCIGEPTVNLPLLDAVLERVRTSPTLSLRSFITNGHHP